LSIDTGKARPSRAGRADWNLLGLRDRAQVLESEIQSELLQLATDLMEQSGLIEWPSANYDDDVERLGLWQLCEEVQKEGDTTQKIFRCPLHLRCGCPLKLRTTRSPSSISLECAGGEHSQARCHQTNNQTTWKGGDGEMDLGRRVPYRQRHGDGCARYCGCYVPSCRRVHARRRPSHG
jgi:hypothetical protein